MPTNRPRPDPKIPDHVVLRRIGGGAYGEVWLARGVTGALRAVKVVSREDFEDARSFEREFEGILKYEPISRDHPALVNVLHVGRSPDGEEFYYYVMELGDDIVSGREINEIEYEARTLRSDMQRAGGKPLDPGFCIDVGLRLAEALKHLHDQGLAHRDIKPSNVIFVGGKAKLADIGLVALRGQRTFVGTEGFVPPEGPGSAQADVYSLGKVLYEMATGKDRLDFPELPDDMPQGPERKQWLALNQIICEVCEPQISKRTIRSAGDLAIALTKLRAGKRRRRRVPVGPLVSSIVLGGLLMWGGWELASSQGWMDSAPPPPPPPSVPAFIKVTSTPDGADVVDVADESGLGALVGRTPTDVLPSFVGERISLRILKEGYQAYEVTTVVPASAADEPHVISAVLKVYAPPVANEPWTDHLGMNYRPVEDNHESLNLVGEPAWRDYLEARGRPEAAGQFVEVDLDGKKRKVVVTSPREAAAFCGWLVEGGIREGYLTEDHEAVARFVPSFPEEGLAGRAKKEHWRPFQVVVREIPYGQIMVRTEPPGAEVYLNGLSRGTGDGLLLLDLVRPGPVEVVVSLEGYKSETRRFVLKPRETRDLQINLRPNKSVVLGRPWENSLGMRLEPVGEEWMVSVWEIRIRDFRAYAEAIDGRMPPAAESSLSVEGDLSLHPVTSVSRDEAEGFCHWLTEKERAEDRLTRSLEYRLPTDLEWSALAGLEDVEETSPAVRDRVKPKIFFWGGQWPPQGKVGNLADEASGVPPSRRVPGYFDGFATTSPVGAFPANERGIHDLCGNVQEWVADSYSTVDSDTGVLRGGGWRSYQEQNLYVGARNPQPPTAIDDTYGFRVVLAKEKHLEEIETESKSDG